MANVGSDSNFCTRSKTSEKSTSVWMISSELQNKPPTKTFCNRSPCVGLILLAVIFLLPLLNRVAYGFETFRFC